MTNSRQIQIAGRTIGGDAPYIIAELAGNHNGDIKRAWKSWRQPSGPDY
jgi:sialic acid synthase SpsE